MLPSCCPPKLYQSGFGLDSKLFSPNYRGYCPVISHYDGMTAYDSAGCYKAMTAVPCKHLVYTVCIAERVAQPVVLLLSATNVSVYFYLGTLVAQQ